MAITMYKKQEVDKFTQAWLMSLACGQIILENQELLEDSNKYRQTLKQATKRFLTEVEKTMGSDINTIFDECEGTSQEILKAIEKLSKVASKMNPANLDRLTKFIEKTGMVE